MKYREIVDLIKTTCLDNYFINEFSYGNISDINTPDDEEPVNYPYAFLNPINITNDGLTSTFSANLIVMTQTYETLDEELTQQSNCINYLEQIISHINMNLDNPLVEFVTPFSITPFKERFSDNVVGATAAISIQYPSNINDCDTPYLRIPKSFTIQGFTDDPSFDDRVFNGLWELHEPQFRLGIGPNEYICTTTPYIVTYKHTGGEYYIVSADDDSAFFILGEAREPFNGCGSLYNGMNIGILGNPAASEEVGSWFNEINGQYVLREGSFEVSNNQRDTITVTYVS